MMYIYILYVSIYIYTFPEVYTVIDMKISSNNHAPLKINKAPSKMVVGRRSFPLGVWPVFRGKTVSFGECILDSSVSRA